MDQFDAYFRRADLDGDGRISGSEAVSFFQGSNLPKHVLAQIWMHADNAKTGFLGRNEFYNALRLVTVAQSKRDLTADIVKAALYGPAAAKIPPPQINLAAIPPLQGNRPVTTPAPVPQIGLSTGPIQSQNFPYRGQQGLSGPVPNPQYFPSQQSTSMRPPQQSMPTPQPVPTSSAPRPQQTFSNPGFSSDWYSGRPGMVATRPGMVATRPGGMVPSSPLSTSTTLSPVSPMSQPTTVNTKALALSGNVLSPNSALGNDFFSAASSTPTQEPAGQNFSFSVGPPSSAIVPVSSVAQPKQNLLGSLQSSFSMQPVNSQFQQTQPAANRSNASQQISPPASSPHASSGISVGFGNTNSDNSQLSWPKMKPADVQKYTKVFMEVDTDKDGRITGEQARSLFLSWRLPIDVLKKVWDLSDQDNDSMLSLKEFCFALYLMERYREGRPLPQSLPNNVLFDETLLSMMGHPKPTYGNAALGVGPGFQSQQGMPGARPVAPAAGLRPPVQGTSPPAPGTMQPNQQKSGAPVLEDSFLNPTGNGDKDILNSNSQEAATAGKKVKETENVILDSREKIVFYRDKMQELVLYKSRCDNRLNEITERASADKREAETLGKKYEEKYKQVAEIASKLTVEEAKFRDIQERKSELQQAIVKMVQGGSADGILQVRAERIQSDLDGLFNALAERCKKHGIDVKSITMVQLPAGWQPGIAEDAALWDEDWDKFEDEGFANDLTFDTKNASSKPAIIHEEQSFPDDHSAGSPVNANGKHENSTNGDYTLEDESSYAHSEDELGRSPRDSPAGKTTVESPQGFSNAHFKESIEADAETNRSFDESTWGAFDNNDDVDSVWGFNPTKDSDLDHQRDFFTSGDDFGINPIRTGSTHTDGAFQTKSPFTFDDSVPATPASKFGNSPRYSEAGDFFDMSSRFDSFSMNESGYSPKAEPRFTRFDSISSSKDFGYNPPSLSRFDSISSSKDFGYNPGTFTRFDSIGSSKDFGFGREAGHARFDSISSTKDFGHSDAFSFDDSDPFGSSGPFKVSSESHSPKKSSDGWSAF
ncbi:PREDICTED: epidermal growth factor receptor substrate 15-like isoform X2 [Lupinus angustifolius]|uniref:epidermal growth factor receptor substrate 15-like isoform X2 n=1 Tax=Lupinus angustifolius TaxID=3871 RepID=UPI00092F4E14|nr:PREDICTED: epidermal growth factor receptor substrate 15-like isoform X2 [Lupinus angustifolius]